MDRSADPILHNMDRSAGPILHDMDRYLAANRPKTEKESVASLAVGVMNVLLTTVLNTCPQP